MNHRLIIPVEASRLALNGLSQLLATLDSIGGKSRRPNILGLVACRASPRRPVHREVLLALEGQFPGKITPCIPENVALVEAPAHGQPVTRYEPSSNGAADYRRVGQWLADRLD